MLLPLGIEGALISPNATNSSAIPGFIPHVIPAGSPRSLFSIVWSCIATLFACAWVAVHPDTPSLDDDKFDRFFHRVKLLIWVLISPEAILVWAWRQHRGAQALRYLYNKPLSDEDKSGVYFQYWNSVHAHFLQMGGFVICIKKNGKETMSIVCPKKFDKLVKQDQAVQDFVYNITSFDIRDRSKGDGLTYFVAIIQLVWFSTQCVGRAVAGLSITLFELVSISFAPISIIMYILWWQKPQNAQSPIILRVSPPDGESPQQEPAGISVPGTDKMRLFFPLSLVERAIKTFEDMLGTTSRSQQVPEDSRRFPPFYAYPHEHKPEDIPMTPLIMGSLLGSIFGIIHIIGWNLRFATRVEKLLWRSAASVIVIVPLFSVLTILSARKLLHRKNQVDNWPYKLRVLLFGLLAGILALSYIIARVILLGVMCTSLRALPPSQLQDITWVTDFPHIL